MTTPTRARRLLRVLAALLLLSPPAFASIVYDNTANPLGFVYPIAGSGQASSYEFGDDATLGGADRAITQFSLWMYSLSTGGNATLEARLYAPDGPAGAPGTVLWDSGPDAVIYVGAFNQFDFAVPAVTVPGSVIWSIQIVNRSPATSQFGPIYADPPAIGSSAITAWANNAPGFPGWNLVHSGNPNFNLNFEARLTAIPSPAPAGLLSIAFAGTLARRRR